MYNHSDSEEVYRVAIYGDNCVAYSYSTTFCAAAFFNAFDNLLLYVLMHVCYIHMHIHINVYIHIYIYIYIYIYM